MAFASNGLRDAFEWQGEVEGMFCTSASSDPLRAILLRGYLNSVSLRLPGNLVYVETMPRPAGSPWARQCQSLEIRDRSAARRRSRTAPRPNFPGARSPDGKVRNLGRVRQAGVISRMA
jgi:hypothetical protein